MFKCRLCFSSEVFSIIPLGEMPLANALLSEPLSQVQDKYNLEVMLCNTCGLAQLRDLIDPAELFSEYVYFSSNSDTMLSSAQELTERMCETLSKDSFIVEVASNDGYLLKNYVEVGLKVLGIDPAENIVQVANKMGIPTRCAFFGEDLAQELAHIGKKADVIHANNVMAHVPDINGFVKGLKILLKDKGKAIIEVPYFLDLVKKLEFDTIYHEHVYYFSVGALKRAFEKQELEIFDIEKLELHGGSLRLFVSHVGAYDSSPIMQSMIQEEQDFGLYQQSTYTVFMENLADLKKTLRKTLMALKNKGARIAAYGASAKGTTLLNYFEIGQNLMEFVVDRSSVKQGKFTPGTYLEIFSPEKLQEEKISYVLLLTWNFADEIISQQKGFIESGGKFIIPLPEVEIVP